MKHGHEERLAGEQTFARAQQRAHETAVRLRAVTENGFHLDAVVHVHHAASFGDGGFVGVEFDFDELHRVAVNLVINFVHLVHSFAFDKVSTGEMMQSLSSARSYKIWSSV